MLKSSLTWLSRHVGFACVAAVLVYCVIHAFDPPRLNWGDSGSDYNVMTAGRNFQKYGFINMRLTPHLLDPAATSPGDPSKLYTHYPQLPDLMNGVERVVFGLSRLWQFRLVALGFSFASLFFVFALIRTYWSEQTAQIALGLWVVNPMWIQHADYLHHAPYGAFFGFGSVYFLTRWLAVPARRGFFLASGMFLFLAFFASYDYWFFAPLLLALVAFRHYGGIRLPAIRTLALLGSFGLAAILCKFATNAWALGGIGALMRDLHFQAVERSSNPAMKIVVGPGVLPTMYGRVDRFFSLLLIPVALFWAAVPLLRGKASRQLRALIGRQPNPWWVLFAALPFLCLFVELWVSQYYPALLVLPFYAIASAALIVLVLESRIRWSRALAAAALVGLFTNSLYEDITFPKAYFPESDVRSLKAQLDTLAQPGQYILVNHFFDFFYAYYFNHATVDLITVAPNIIDQALAYYDNPRRVRTAPPTGAIYVQHKHLSAELYDKNDYFLLARHGFWAAWAEPERYRAGIDTLVAEHDSVLTAAVARIGTKVAETDAYVIWRIMPGASKVPDPSEVAGSAGAAKNQAHLAEIDR